MSEIFKNISMDVEKSYVYGHVDGFSLQNLFYVKNGYFPNCYMFADGKGKSGYVFDVAQIIAHFTETRDKNEFQCIKYMTRNMTSDTFDYGFCFIDVKNNLFGRIERRAGESYILFGDGSESELNGLVSEILEFYTETPKEKNNLYTIASDSTGFSLIKQNISEKKLEGFDINKQYNDDFKKEDTKIEKFISDNDKSGLIILHGDKGTGKTTYIRHLINIHPERRFVFVPSNLITMLGDPAFGSFLMSLSNNVIILEDCENAIRDRQTTGTSSAVSLLLNMTDGLLSDDLGIKFICTFNEDVRNIDKALLRKGRLVSKYEFKALDVEKANILLKEVYERDMEEWDDKADKPEMYHTEKELTLADIFNFTEDAYDNNIKRII